MIVDTFGGSILTISQEKILFVSVCLNDKLQIVGQSRRLLPAGAVSVTALLSQVRTKPNLSIYHSHKIYLLPEGLGHSQHLAIPLTTPWPKTKAEDTYKTVHLKTADAIFEALRFSVFVTLIGSRRGYEGKTDGKTEAATCWISAGFTKHSWKRQQPFASWPAMVTPKSHQRMSRGEQNPALAVLKRNKISFYPF